MLSTTSTSKAVHTVFKVASFDHGKSKFIFIVGKEVKKLHVVGTGV